MRISGTQNFPAMDKVVFGKPAAAALRAEAEARGTRRVFLVVSRSLNTKTDEIAKIRAALGDRLAGVYDSIPQHTSRQAAADAAKAALAAKADLIVAIGGGSVVDAAKIMLICIEHKITEPNGLDGFAIKIGADGRPLRPEFRGASVRMIAVPTTLSGGEFNAGALVTDTERDLKETYFHPTMVPLAIILDPALTLHTPLPVWVGSGTRAMDHAIEAACSPAGTPLADAVVLHGVELMANALPQAKAAPDDPDLRRQCQFASWLCSYGLHTRVPMGASHAIGHVLGGTCHVPHYFCTPVMLPSVMRYNLPATADAQQALARALGRPGGDAGEAFRDLVSRLGLPTRLQEVGVREDQFELVARNTLTEIFIFSNPRRVAGWEDVREILRLAA